MTWTHRVARDGLSTETRNTLGAIQSIFQVAGQPAAELRKHAVPLSAPPESSTAVGSDEKDEALVELLANTAKKSEEFIEDRLAKLTPDELPELVAGILRAMGYKTRVSPKGADRGVDIFASPDGLGLQEPRIFVEVKHRPTTPMGSQDIRAFLGGRKQGDRCLYVSTGGYSKDARYEADRSSVPLTLIALPELRGLVVDHYEKLDSETKRLVPLTRLYWPVSPK